MIKHLLTSSGKGKRFHIRTVGHFEVRCPNHTTDFTHLEEAYQFFLDQNEEAALWDVTSINELLESKVWDC